MNQAMAICFAFGIILFVISMWGVDNQKIHWENRQAMAVFLFFPGIVLMAVGALLFAIKVGIVLWRLW